MLCDHQCRHERAGMQVLADDGGWKGRAEQVCDCAAQQRVDLRSAGELAAIQAEGTQEAGRHPL